MRLPGGVELHKGTLGAIDNLVEVFGRQVDHGTLCAHAANYWSAKVGRASQPSGVVGRQKSAYLCREAHEGGRQKLVNELDHSRPQLQSLPAHPGTKKECGQSWAPIACGECSEKGCGCHKAYVLMYLPILRAEVD